MQQPVRDFETSGFRVIIHELGGYYTGTVREIEPHLCAYIGIKYPHPLYGLHYDKIDLSCHGGLTYSEYGDDLYLPEGYWWIGWDYAHFGDSIREFNAVTVIGEASIVAQDLSRGLYEIR